MELRRGLWREQGQSLIVVTLMLVALIGFLGLVVDVGSAYAQRRFMQNAADAAALAGARELALNKGLPVVQGKVREYALTLNSAQTVISDVQQSTVSVTVTKVLSTYFMSVLGIQASTVQAAAQAGYCPLGKPQGVVPFGVYKDNIKYYPTQSVIWDSLTVSDIPEPPPGWSIAKDNLIQKPQRGWINLEGFTGTGHPAAQTLKEILAGVTQDPLINNPWRGTVELGTYDGTTGDNATVIGRMLAWFDDTVANFGADSDRLDVIVPVYDAYWQDPTGSDATYHISGFAVFHVTKVWKYGTEKYIAGYFKQSVPGESLQKQARCGTNDYGARILELLR